MSEEIEYDPVMVQWMRENREPTAVTKPELAAALAQGLIPPELTNTQEEHLVTLIEAAAVAEAEGPAESEVS